MARWACQCCRYAVTRGTFPLSSQYWEEGDVYEQRSTRDTAQPNTYGDGWSGRLFCQVLFRSFFAYIVLKKFQESADVRSSLVGN